jgi:O-Antigen ligase
MATPLRRPPVRRPPIQGPGRPPVRAGRFAASRPRDGNTAATAAHKATSFFKDPFRIGISLLLIDTISKTSGEIPAAASIRPGLLLFVGCAFYAVLNSSKVLNLRVFQYRVPQLIAGQALIACGSALFGISLGHSAVYIITTYWKTLALAFLLIVSLRTIDDVRRMVWATAGGGLLLALVSVFVNHVSKTQGGAVYDANDIGTIVVMTLPLVIFAAQMSKGLVRTVCIGGLVLIAGCIVLSESRGAFVGLVFVGAAILLFLPGISAVKRIMYVAAIGTTLAVFAPAGYWDTIIATFTNPTADYNWDAGQGRRQLAKRGIGYMMDYPIFGLGIDNFEMEEGLLSDYALSQTARGIGVKWSAPHNSWVEAGAETGIPGVLLWAALVVGSSVSLIKLRKRMPKSWASDGTPDQRFVYLATLYVPIALLGFVVCATFVSFAWSDQSYVLPAIAMGVQMVCEKQFGLSLRAPAPRVTRAGRGALRPSAV